MKIHVSKTTADLLHGTEFIVQERGEFEVKVNLYILSYILYCNTINVTITNY